MNNPTLSMEDKIHRIEETASLNEVSLECLPPVQTDKYYFVSYSHKDYKLVYKDIFNRKIAFFIRKRTRHQPW